MTEKACSRTVWTTAFGDRAAQLRDALAPALRCDGVEPVGVDGSERERHGLVFVAEGVDAACNWVEDVVRRHSSCRVLIVACDSLVLDHTLTLRLMAAGSSDVLTCERPDQTSAAIAARLERWREVDALVASAAVSGRLVGESREWQKVLRSIVEIARFSEGSVVICGETGTGKELVARLVHGLDPKRKRNALVLLDCTTVVPTLSGSEFFGHERGAFTGAVSTREGAFEQADGGTLFLDEVGELPRSLQAELLRVVQEGTYKRVGSNTWRQTRFRLVCATNRDLRAEADHDEFRRDFYHRIAEWTIRLPSLHERREDILPLARHFLAELRAPMEPPALDELVRRNLMSRDYPGNVRDLRHVILRVHDRHVGRGPVTIGDLDADEPASEPIARGWFDGPFEQGVRRAVADGVPLKEIGSTAVDLAVATAVREENGNLRRAARRLGVTPRALQLRRAAGRGPAEDDAHAGDG